MPTPTAQLIRLLKEHLVTGEATRSDVSDLHKIPVSVPLEYLPGVTATLLPIHLSGLIVMIMDMEKGTTTGRILHDCKKRAVCMFGSFADPVSGVRAEAQRSVSWRAETVHEIEALEKSRILLQFNY